MRGLSFTGLIQTALCSAGSSQWCRHVIYLAFVLFITAVLIMQHLTFVQRHLHNIPRNDRTVLPGPLPFNWFMCPLSWGISTSWYCQSTILFLCDSVCLNTFSFLFQAVGNTRLKHSHNTSLHSAEPATLARMERVRVTWRSAGGMSAVRSASAH